MQTEIRALVMFGAVSLLVIGLPGLSWAHNLPVSYVTIVPDGNQLHLELALNSSELAFFAEIDTNRNARIDATELQGHSEEIARRIVDCLQLRVDDVLLVADVCDLVPDLDTHHFTLRAHFATDVRQSTLALESQLSRITGGSHVTQVAFHGVDQVRVARLNANSPEVVLVPARMDHAQRSRALTGAPGALSSLPGSRKLLFSIVAISAALTAGTILVLHKRQHGGSP